MRLPRTSGGGGVRDARPVDAASRTVAASSGNVRSGRHSSRPSCHTRESSFTAPSAALRRTSAMRIGPTGTPLTATYQSSPGESSDMSNGADTSSSRWTFDFNALASAPGGRSGLGAGDLVEAKLAARDVWRAGAGRPGALGGPAGAAAPPAGPCGGRWPRSSRSPPTEPRSGGRTCGTSCAPSCRRPCRLQFGTLPCTVRRETSRADDPFATLGRRHAQRSREGRTGASGQIS